MPTLGKKESVGKVSLGELSVQLRQNYIGMLKRAYWERFEEGQCLQDSVIALNESADRCLDDPECRVNDWEYVQESLVSTGLLECLGQFSTTPCIGSGVKQYLFGHLSLSYDITVNFIEAHEHASKTLKAISSQTPQLESVLREAETQVEHAEQFMATTIEDSFPEISKAIQHRRAERFLLVHQLHDIDRMLHRGEIQEKDAGELKHEIEEKQHDLILSPPSIKLLPPKERLLAYSELADIFPRS